MEKIKQALEQARRDRGTERGRGRLEFGARRKSSNMDLEESISYSQTKVLGRPSSSVSTKRLMAHGQSDPFATSFKMLRTQLLQRMKSQGWNTLAITSPMPGDGKTLIAANLGISLSMELHHTVLLVDLDFRNPSMHTMFEFEPTIGVADYLNGDILLSDVLINPGIERLVVLPGRERISNSSELLASPTTMRMVDDIKSRYPSRFVLFDLPPVLVADDAIAFSPYVDAALIVIEDGKTTKDELERSMELLKETPIVGTVLNRSNENIGSYY